MPSRLDELLIVQVDPSLFTPPYDAALAGGLALAGHQVIWAVRDLRPDEAQEIDPTTCRLLFYRGVEGSAKLGGSVGKARKAVSHVLSLLRLVRFARNCDADVIHFQWLLFPLADLLAIHWLARRSLVVVTVHDVEAFNNAPTSLLQTLGYRRALRAASRLIVHTAEAKTTLAEAGLEGSSISVIAHGPLAEFDDVAVAPPVPAADGRWRLVMFGKLQTYKGLDVLIEAVGRLTPAERDSLRVVVAGEPLMDMGPLQARIRELGLGNTFDLRLGRLSEADMAALFGQADGFIFPYLAIQASGVLFLTLPWRRWMIASDLGAFRDFVQDGRNGFRVAPGDTEALACAIVASIGAEPVQDYQPAIPSWTEIAGRTVDVYRSALEETHAHRIHK